MNQTQKLIFGIVVLVAAIGLIIFQVKRLSNDAGMSEVSSQEFQSGKTNLEALFGKVNGKWTSDSLWIDKASAKASASKAAEIFGDSPSMNDVKIIDANTDPENHDQLNLILQVGNMEQCVSVSIAKSPKTHDYVFVSAEQLGITIKQYKSDYL